MTQVTVYIPGRVPHRIARSALEKFTARYPDALVAPALPAHAVDAAVGNGGHTPLQTPQLPKAPSRLKKAELTGLLRDEFSFQAPGEWGRKRLIDEINSRRRRLRGTALAERSATASATTASRGS